MKLKIQPRITASIHKTNLVINSLFKKYIKLKDLVKKTDAQDKYKYYRNLLSTIIKKIKKYIYKKFIKNNMNNLKILGKQLKI